jgi:hypothetical protein
MRSQAILDAPRQLRQQPVVNGCHLRPGSVPRNVTGSYGI